MSKINKRLNSHWQDDTSLDSRLVSNQQTGYTHSHQTVTVTQWQQNDLHQLEDEVATETPIAMSYNGVSHAVMMATPENLEDFAVGFSLSEGIADKAEDIYDMHIIHHSQGLEVAINLASNCFNRLKHRRRQLAGRTGCGLCGVESLEQAIRQVKPLTPQSLPAHNSVQAGLNALTKHQHLRTLTGAVHAAAWCDQAGEIQLVREDVGRHNALDKLLGGLATTGINITTGFVIVSSRASYEMVHKACQLGICTLVAASAPTYLAVRQAKYAGMNLIAFARGNRHVIYNQAYK
ncbi:formate dehydrogenase accessory sulfurtransferase FdhD [Spartinivicinus marinus]|uniref:formate dehydrogenase accessory sulfurtransferase FdhD n=1 Tax=Spartinivicinus marinus TaxID=2994442 RepID=UPI00224F418F|nr:formate dehydrogenase accessory sulfurtransferase FdhD [Spartinivicinus marinus]MCX4028161.1 formate dehydrogenase accessory sulfurtransferase FdhD [Spartinivicinus marinus]